MAVLTLVKSNLKRRKGSIISIFLLVFIIALSLTTIISVNLGVTSRVVKACKDSNVTDIVSFIKDINVNDTMTKELKDSKEVESVEVLDSIASDKFSINGKYANSAVFFTAYNPEKHPYKLINTNGMSYQKDSNKIPNKGEVYIPIAFRDMYDCKIGDMIKIQSGNENYTYRISQFLEEPFVGASMIGFKILLMNGEDIEFLRNKQDGKILTNFKMLNVDLKQVYKKDSFDIKKELNERTGFVNDSIFTLLLSEANNYTLLFTNILSGILWAFAVLLFFATLMIIGHNVSTSIEMEYVTYGILKSQGFTSLQIRLIILLQYALACMAAVVTGMLLSKLTIQYVNGIFIPVNGLIIENDVKILESLGCLLILIGIIGFYTYMKTRKVAKISPVQAISLGHEPVYFKSHMDFSITNNLPIPLSMKIIIKNIVVNIKKYISNILIIAILTFFAITVTSLQQMTSDVNVDNIFGSIGSDITVTYTKDEYESVVKEIEDYIKDQTNVTKNYQLANQYLTLDGMEYLSHIISNTKNVIYPLEGRSPKYDNEIIITEILSDQINKTIGDTVSIKSSNKEEDYIIVGIYQNTSDAGKNFSILLSGIKRIEPNYTIRSTEYGISDRKMSGKIVKYLKEKYKEYSETIEIEDVNAKGEEQNNTVIIAINALTAITYLLTILFVAVVSFMVSYKMFAIEKVDLGIYKSLGFTTGSLRNQFAARFVFIAFIGSMIGMCMNFLWNDQLMSVLLRGMGISHYVTQYTIWNLFLPVSCVCGFTAIFSYMVSSKMKRVSPKNLIQE